MLWSSRIFVAAVGMVVLMLAFPVTAMSGGDLGQCMFNVYEEDPLSPDDPFHGGDGEVAGSCDPDWAEECEWGEPFDEAKWSNHHSQMAPGLLQEYAHSEIDECWWFD